MFDFADVFTAAGLATLGQVILIDLIFSGDNAMVLGTVAAGLPPQQRRQVLGLGVIMAMVCLIGFALVATQLLQIVGLLLAGGILLLWVAWKLYAEIGHATAVDAGVARKHPKTFAQAAVQVAVTNLSLSLDNVLAVAGAAREHPAVLLFGLGLSVTLMAVAANFIARFISRYHWIAYIGLVVILFVAGRMIYDGLIDRHLGVVHLFLNSPCAFVSGSPLHAANTHPRCFPGGTAVMPYPGRDAKPLRKYRRCDPVTIARIQDSGHGAMPLRTRRRSHMKINVEVECTPEEARRFMGLPDLTPIHEKYVAMLGDAMSGTLAPDMLETMARSWMPMSDAGLGLWRKMFEGASK